jgi:hypothetical protein
MVATMSRTKTLEADSCLNQMDLNNDGLISESEIALQTKLDENERKNEKAEFNRHIATSAMISLVVVMGILLSGWIPESRIVALSDILGTFFFAQATLVGAVIGVTSWMSKG